MRAGVWGLFWLINKSHFTGILLMNISGILLMNINTVAPKYEIVLPKYDTVLPKYDTVAPKYEIVLNSVCP